MLGRFFAGEELVFTSGVGKGVMITLIKLAAAGVIGLGMLAPGFTPRADNCECKAKANGATFAVPRADDCECKAKANALQVVPHADNCECKAKAN